ncbi:MAG TPA: class I SAM-dependent methyltransferase [Solirubrobacteraceae bacterium]|jgi:2-polyprenyl-3-methyl-5-hydroxy-6-metoxy-1,4-benzoquinol methylase|nr:class I SAM-dependent methyltransferase [Solirubrobacteraceae bacterium]
MDSRVWDERYAGSELVWTSEPNRFLVAEIDGLSPARALDLACGEGRNAVWLAQCGWTVTGVDFSAVGLAKAQRLAESRGVRVDWVQADLAGYRPPHHAFELVIVFYLQVAAPMRSPILTAAAEAVAPGGTFLLVAHDLSNITEGHGGPQDPGVLYTAEDVVDDLSGSALTIERAERVQRPVATPQGERIALDALVRAYRSGS